MEIYITIYKRDSQLVICCMAQESQTGALNQPRGIGWGRIWERGSKGRGYMYTYGWFMLRFDIKQEKILKQLSFNSKINILKRININKSIPIHIIFKELKANKKYNISKAAREEKHYIEGDTDCVCVCVDINSYKFPSLYCFCFIL